MILCGSFAIGKKERNREKEREREKKKRGGGGGAGERRDGVKERQLSRKVVILIEK